MYVPEILRYRIHIAMGGDELSGSQETLIVDKNIDRAW